MASISAMSVAENHVSPSLGMRHEPTAEVHAVRRPEADLLERQAGSCRVALRHGMQRMQCDQRGVNHKQAEGEDLWPEASQPSLSRVGVASSPAPGSGKRD